LSLYSYTPRKKIIRSPSILTPFHLTNVALSALNDSSGEDGNTRGLEDPKEFNCPAI